MNAGSHQAWLDAAELQDNDPPLLTEGAIMITTKDIQLTATLHVEFPAEWVEDAANPMSVRDVEYEVERIVATAISQYRNVRLEAICVEASDVTLKDETASTKINTGDKLLVFLRQEYAAGRSYTFTELQAEIGRRNGIEPAAFWLNTALWTLSDTGEISMPVGPIIPTGVLISDEARRFYGDEAR